MPDTPSRVKPKRLPVLRRLWDSQVASTAILAAAVGALTGLGAVGFIELISLCTRLFFSGGAHAFAALGGWYILLLPVIGGLAVGPLIHFLAPEASGHGVPEVMTAMETAGGRIRPVVILVKTVASAITIGSGGSAGREGPIVQIGAALGSNFGQVLKMDRSRLLALVRAGAAGGIAATFNAPIAGVMFSIEVLTGEYTVVTISSMVFASVSASVVARAFLGSYPAFHVPTYIITSNWELFMYLGLGVLAAGGGLLFIRSLYFAEDVFDKWQIPGWLKPPAAGLAIGLIGYFLPQALGTGFGAMNDVLRGQLGGFWLLIALLFGRVAATSLTLGSGFSGGVFAPMLFEGAMMGGAYGKIMHALFPGVVASSGPYATVGMAAVFAAGARAPVTAIVILFEMTLDYNIMLPLMFATVVATLLAARFEPESVYTLKLVHRGIDFMSRRTGRLPAIGVGDAMTQLDGTWLVEPTTSLDELSAHFREQGHRGAVVVDSSGRLQGVVTMTDLEHAAVDGDASTVGEIHSRAPLTAFSDETLDEIVKHAGMLDVGYIPVVTRERPNEPIGILQRSDIIRAYGSAISVRDRRRVSFERRRAQHLFGLQPIEIVLQEGDPGVGKTLREIHPPPETVIVSVSRGEVTMVPRGETLLKVGDRIAALALGDGGHILGRLLKGGNYR